MNKSFYKVALKWKTFFKVAQPEQPAIIDSSGWFCGVYRAQSDPLWSDKPSRGGLIVPSISKRMEWNASMTVTKTHRRIEIDHFRAFWPDLHLNSHLYWNQWPNLPRVRLSRTMPEQYPNIVPSIVEYISTLSRTSSPDNARDDFREHCRQCSNIAMKKSDFKNDDGNIINGFCKDEELHNSIVLGQTVNIIGECDPKTWANNSKIIEW